LLADYMELCELLGGMTLGELLRRIEADEIYLWIARAERKAKREGQRRTAMKGRR
jgi:hypothetical protein